jgi:hypothetical protein
MQFLRLYIDLIANAAAGLTRPNVSVVEGVLPAADDGREFWISVELFERHVNLACGIGMGRRSPPADQRRWRSPARARRLAVAEPPQAGAFRELK